MKKANKTSFIILLCLALLFIGATAALLFVPEPKPLKITEKITIESADGEYILHGKIKNVSKTEIVIDTYDLYAQISATNENGKKVGYFIRPNQTVTLQPNEEVDFSFMRTRLGTLESVKLDRVVYSPEKTGITLCGNVVNNGKFAIFALLTGVIGAVLLIIAIASYAYSVKEAKRVNNILEQIAQTLKNGIYAAGYYGNRAKNRTAAAKTTASVLGAIISAFFIGFGRYKVYSQSSKDEFIITETSIYMPFDGKFVDITNDLKSTFKNPAIVQKRNKISVKGEDKNIFLILRAKDGTTEKDEILKDLKNIFNC